jgi:pimeloyl-ACP methyl ester carboxylesterase
MAVPSRAAFRLILRKNEPKPLPRSFIDRMYDDMDPATRRAILSLYRPTFRLERLVLRPFPESPRIPVEQAYRQRDTFPSADVAVLPRSGHWPHIDDPAGVESFVVPFLRRQLC